MALWMKTEVEFGMHDAKPFRAIIEALVHVDARRADTIDVALFIKSGEYDKTTMLLSPDASSFFLFMPGDWVPSNDHFEHEWGVLLSNGVTPQDFGLKSP